MSENKVNNLLGASMDKIKEMVDVNTVVGDPITTPDGTTVIPVSRVSYGLAGGGGIAVLFGRYELNFRARYYFGLSDVVRNRNKYYDNTDDGPENPFWTTPMRSPLDNITITVGLSYRFNKEGFETWKPRPKREKNRRVFKYGL